MGPPGVPMLGPFNGPFAFDAPSNFFMPGPLAELVLLLASGPRFAFCPNLNLLYDLHTGPRYGNTVSLHVPCVGKIISHGGLSSGVVILARFCLFVKHLCVLLLSAARLSGIGSPDRS